MGLAQRWHLREQPARPEGRSHPGNTDESHAEHPILLPISNGIPAIDIHMRGSNANVFHVAAGGTMLQLEMPDSTPGHSNRIRLSAISNQLSSFRFTPQAAISNFTPKIGFAISNGACATFQWLGLDAVSNKTQEFRALKSQRAVDYRNDSGKPTQHFLRVDAVDARTTNNTCAVFGPFNVPAGAVHCVVLQDWPRVKQVRSELDLNADGTPDEVTMVTGTEIDSDGDGMPDGWEVLHQFNPSVTDCDDDADKDLDPIGFLPVAGGIGGSKLGYRRSHAGGRIHPRAYLHTLKGSYKGTSAVIVNN
jgi:hypothetical protein